MPRIDPVHMPLCVQDMLHIERLARRKTLHQGQTDNCKFDNGRYRIWLSRMSPEDWTGAGARVPEGFPITVEKLINGCWVAVYGDGAGDD